jgi:carbon monoxide dehydrogenase subunit G
MKIEGEHLFNGPRQDVWDMIQDPVVLASAVPGMDKLDKISDTEYVGKMNIRIGPVSGAFDGKLTMQNPVPPESTTLVVEGKGAPGFVKGAGNAQFIEQEADKTMLKYDADLSIGGTLASVGQRMIDSVAKSMMRTAFETLDKALEARIAAKALGKATEEVEYKKASEADYAKAVAKDAVGGLTSSAEGKLVIYIIPMIVIVVILAVLLSRCSG